MLLLTSESPSCTLGSTYFWVPLLPPLLSGFMYAFSVSTLGKGMDLYFTLVPLGVSKILII